MTFLQHRRFGWAAAVLLLLAFALGPVSAQTGIANDFTRFTAGGRSDHLIIYPLGSEVLRDNVTAALDEAALTYQALWGGTGIEFQIAVGFIDHLNESDPGVYADAEYAPISRAGFLQGYETGLNLDPTLCAIEIYPPFVSDPARLSTIAHELAHCYQYYRQIGDVHLRFDPPSMNWWVEGSAEWMASIVYPLQFPTMPQSSFVYSNDVLTGSYDNLYWWSFLASPQGLGSQDAVISFLRGVPKTGTQYPEAINTMSAGENAIELFHRWAFALLDGRVPFNPPLDFSAMPRLNASTPGSARLSQARFSVSYAQISGFTVDPGNRAFVQVDGIDTGHYGISVRAAGQDSRLQAGSPHLFCPDGGSALLVSSRGMDASDDFSPFTVTWGQMPSSAPCTEDDQHAATCLVGDWQVVTFPASIAVAGGMNVDTSEFLFTFGADGSVSGSYDIIVQADGVTLDLDMPINGTYAVSAVEGSPGRFAVRSFNWAFDNPGGRYVATYRDGSSFDFTQNFYSMGGADLWAPNGVIACAGDTLSWVAADGSGSFVLQRQ